MAIDVPIEDDPAPVSVLTDPGTDDDLPPMPATATLAAFASRRKGDAPSAPLSATKPGALAAPPRPVAKVPDLPPVRAKAPASRGATAAAVTAPSIPGTRKRKPVAAQPAPATMPAAVTRPTPSAQPTARAATMTGTSFRTNSLDQRGRPRHLGLILTIVLLVVIAIAAAASSFLLASRDEAAVVQVATDQTAVPPAEAVPSEQDEMLADMQDPGEFADEPSEGMAGDAVAASTALPAAPTEPETAVVEESVDSATPPDPIPDADAIAAVAPATSATGTPQDEIFLATTDLPPAA